MKPSKILRRALVLTAVVSTASLAACAKSEQPDAKAPVSVSTPTTAAIAHDDTSRKSDRDADRSGATGVALDDAIAKACGIPASEARFDFDSSRINAGETTPLAKVAACFTTGALAGRSLSLVGRADPRGGSEYNVALGQSRADAVGVYLRGKGVRRGQVSTSSRGSMDASGSDEAGWARDRRVDILLMK
jgi:peptidoglycan-associated lipoprotein